MFASFFTTTTEMETPRQSETIIVINGETQITIMGFNTPEYIWRVHSLRRFGPDIVTHLTYAIGPADSSGWYDATPLGPAAAWYSPETFARCIMDMLHN